MKKTKNAKVKKLSKKMNIIIATSIIGMATLSTTIIVPIVVLKNDNKKPNISIKSYISNNNTLNLSLTINRSNPDSTLKLKEKIINTPNIRNIQEIRLEINAKMQIIIIKKLDGKSHNLEEFIENNPKKWFDSILSNTAIKDEKNEVISPTDNELIKPRD